MTIKTCAKCKVEKLNSDFYKQTSAKDGLQKQCKECKAEYQRNDPNRKVAATRYARKHRAELKTARLMRGDYTDDEIRENLFQLGRKSCCRCSEIKSLDSFGKSRKLKHGYNTYCKSCVSELGHEQYIKHRDNILAHQSDYRISNPDKVHASKQAWLENNPEKRRAISAAYYRRNKAECNRRVLACVRAKSEYYTAKAIKWQRENRDRYLACRRACYQRNRGKEIARRRKRMGMIKSAINLSMALQTEIEGFYQFCSIFPEFEVDHILPLNGKRVSGLHVPANLQPLTRTENRSKGRKVAKSDLVWQKPFDIRTIRTECYDY